MPLYAIKRSVPGLTRGDLDGAALRAIVCAIQYPGLTWVRSFWSEDEGELLCIYEGASVEEIREHSRRSAIPCDDVAEVIELQPSDLTAFAPAAASTLARPR